MVSENITEIEKEIVEGQKKTKITNEEVKQLNGLLQKFITVAAMEMEYSVADEFTQRLAAAREVLSKVFWDQDNKKWTNKIIGHLDDDILCEISYIDDKRLNKSSIH